MAFMKDIGEIDDDINFDVKSPRSVTVKRKQIVESNSNFIR